MVSPISFNKCHASRYSPYFCRFARRVKCKLEFVIPVTAKEVMCQSSIGISKMAKKPTDPASYLIAHPTFLRHK